MNKEHVTVSQYLDKLNTTLKEEKAKILGEVSGMQLHQSGHLYFSLLDKVDRSKIDCVLWKSKYDIYGKVIQNGTEILATVVPNIYKPWGKLSAQVEVAELVGEGALQVAYEKLKKKLELEGLFSEDRKRPLPQYPHKIGVITSKSGAVINDFLTNIGKFGYEILFVDSKVEGAEATPDLLSAVETLRDKDLDVLVIMRGGGSLESFQAFNNEALIRAVSTFPVPVLTGIGHDKDLPLLSMLSDKNVSTPTAVANLLNYSWIEALHKVNLYQEKILSSFSQLMDVFKKAEDTLLRAVDRIENTITRYSDTVSSYTKDMLVGFQSVLDSLDELLNNSEKVIELSNPERLLKHGYSIVRSGGKIVKSKKDVSRGDDLDITLTDGIIHTIIK
ncbi:MAG TPA: exodeoxyribonuclease VII large subunit [Parcubacteria group bacterium]|jgi:exodeoxyribonuclease VII large subunit|nr:exodeoxyribonuclease VII large subunit [Parcubacteria group bacterium]